MSIGYKSKCLEDGAIAFWTFDADSYDRDTFIPLHSSIIDETGNHHAVINIEAPTHPAFVLGNTSLVDLERSNQYSGVFGSAAKPVPNTFPKTYLSALVPHTRNNGSFTIEFLMRKMDEGTVYAPYGGNFWSKTSPIIRRNNVFRVDTRFTWNDVDQPTMIVEGPLGSDTISYANAPYMAMTLHFVMTFNITQVASYEFSAAQRVYINNRLVASRNQTFYDYSYPVTNNGNPIEIGGYSNVTAPSDRNAAALTIDQIAFYDRALSYTEVSTHWKKSRTYAGCIVGELPRNYWTMQHQDGADNVISPSAGSTNGLLMGSTIRRQPGPDKIPSSFSIEMLNDGMMWCATTGANGTFAQFMTINNSYSIEFWYRTGTTKVASLMCMQGLDPTFGGPLIEINTLNGVYTPGALQFTERNGVSIGYAANFNDNVWHHVAATRNGAVLRMYVDGYAVGVKSADYSTFSAPGQLIWFAGPIAGRFAGPGALAHCAIYSYALSAEQVQMRSTYAMLYVIRGIVTLQGNPYPATIRFYNSNTGELIDEIQSDSVTGEYEIAMPTNASVDILVFDSVDKNVRYRAYGPVSPSEMEDLPITL